MKRQTDQETPLAVKLIVSVGLLSVLLSLLAVFPLFLPGRLPFLQDLLDPEIVEYAARFVLAVVLLGVVLAQGYALIGLLALKTWAWKASLVLFGLNLSLGVYAFDLVSIALNGVVVLYLLGQKAYFTGDHCPATPQ